jgi:hypothetical protein
MRAVQDRWYGYVCIGGALVRDGPLRLWSEFRSRVRTERSDDVLRGLPGQRWRQ